jgi:hypothetical protein
MSISRMVAISTRAKSSSISGTSRKQMPVKIGGEGISLWSDDLKGGLDEEYGIVFEEAKDFD